MARIKFQISLLFCNLIKIYQYFISSLLPSACRFYPSCSCYALDAITTKGVTKGLFLTIKRILRCHPWHPGGYDPVEPTK